MKTIILNSMLLLCFFATSCKLDNYDGPDSKFFGKISDSETGELIHQDIIDGSVISYLELGWNNTNPSYLRFHTDGTFRNNLVFSGEYEIQPIRGNFHPIEKKTMQISGDFEYNISALPYLRIKDAKITVVKDTAYAEFKVQQVGDASSKNVVSFVLCCDMSSSVCYAVSSGGRLETNPNFITDAGTVYKLKMPLTKENIKKNGKYYFKIGTRVDIPEAKHNYAKHVRLDVSLER